MRIIAFVLDPPTIERILRRVDQPHEPPAVLPVRSPPQAEFMFNQDAGAKDWPDLAQTAGARSDSIRWRKNVDLGSGGRTMRLNFLSALK